MAFRRVARIWKRGGAILKEWEVCKRPWLEFSLTLNQFQTVCQNLRRNVSERSEIQTFFPPKFRWSPKKKKKKKKGLRQNSEWFFGRNPKFKRFFRRNLGDLQKKKSLRQHSRRFFFQNFAGSNVSGGALFAWGGLFSIFHRKSASKAQKTRNFAFFTSQWGGSSTPRPPLATLLMALNTLVLDLLGLFVYYNGKLKTVCICAGSIKDQILIITLHFVAFSRDV